MTRAQSMDVLNDTTTMQSRIDTVLAAPVLDYANDSGWHPGDPLYKDPRLSFDADAQVVRPMFELLWEYEWSMRCEPCRVSWGSGDTCWNCGAECPRVRGFVTPMVSFDEPWVMAMRPMVEAMNEWSEQIARLSVPLAEFRQRYGYIEWSSADSVEQRAVTWIGADTGRLWSLDVENASEPPQVEPLAAWERELLGLPETDVITIPAGAEITPVAKTPLPDRISVAGRRRRRPPSPRFYFDRPVTEQRRPR